jgi:hypothetical protein
MDSTEERAKLVVDAAAQLEKDADKKHFCYRSMRVHDSEHKRKGYEVAMVNGEEAIHGGDKLWMIDKAQVSGLA